jgi:hypothetical protein
MKIEMEHEGSCLGATGGTGQLIVRDRAPATFLQQVTRYQPPE